MAVAEGWLGSSARHFEIELCFIWSVLSEEAGLEVYVPAAAGGTHIAQGISSDILTLLIALQEAWVEGQAAVGGEHTEGLRQLGQVQSQKGASSLLRFTCVQLALPVGEGVGDWGKVEQLD